MTVSPATFVVSLDFELFWGVRDKRTLEQYGVRIAGVRAAVPAILNLFRAHEIHATWATVGFLFFENKAELLENLPSRLPEYERSSLSPYRVLDRIGADERSDPYHFAPSLIQRILDTPNQEVGTHTFSHFYCLEAGQDDACFRADIEAAQRVARAKFGIDLRSIVFPRNQCKVDYLQSCGDLGLRAYRGTLSSWLFQPRNEEDESLIRRAGRLLDAFAPLSGTNAYSAADKVNGVPMNVPASRFLRPERVRSLAPMRKHRIIRDLRLAAEGGKVYHLWWHPHNFGTNLNANLEFLESILAEVSALRADGRMRSMNMAELAESMEAR